MTEEAKLAADTLRKMANFKQFLAFPQDTGKIINACADLIESLSAQLEQVTRERDAAMESVNARRACTDCAFDDFAQIGIPECRTCDRGSNWQWRGVEVE